MGESRFATRVMSAVVRFRDWPLATPLRLSSGLIESVTQALVAVRVAVGGREATGLGSIFLSEQWAWPDDGQPRQSRALELQRLARWVASGLSQLTGPAPAHPLELGLRLHASIRDPAQTGGFDAVPDLARLLTASPFDAAIHDAVGRAKGCSAYRFYDEPVEIPSADRWFGEEGAALAIGRMLRHLPRREFPATLVVGPGDVSEKLDRLLEHWVGDRGYRRVKLKLPGKDPQSDAERCVEVVRGMRSRGIERPWVSVDTNGANGSIASVRGFLEELRGRDQHAWEAVRYLEQPTSRDVAGEDDDWRQLSPAKPVILDEGLVSLEALAGAVERGWNGVGLKTCKGHSFMLVVAAWAARRRLLVTLQDLTNPGLAAVHAAWFGAFVPTANGLELNSPQFVPAANAAWLSRYRELLDPRVGVHRLVGDIPNGVADWCDDECNTLADSSLNTRE